MLFFNLHLLESKTKNDKEIYSAMHSLYSKKYIKKNITDPSVIIPSLGKGNSFLINPTSLFKETKDIVYASQYIKLAGRRSYMQYSRYGIKYLDLSYFPDISFNTIKTNYLLNIIDNKIYFKFEEY